MTINRIILDRPQYNRHKIMCVRRSVVRYSPSGGSFTDMRAKIKFVDAGHVRKFVSPQGDTEYLLPGEAARKTLEFYCPPHQNREQWRTHGPLFWTPYIGKALYIDLVSAYHQIYKQLPLDLSASFGKLKANRGISLVEVANFLEYWKQARNAIPGLLYAWRIMIVKNRSYLSVPAIGPYHNQAVWYVCNVILHNIAKQSMRHGAVFVNTDGFIITKNAEIFLAFLDNYGLQYRTIEGDAHIVRWNVFSVRGMNQNGEPDRKSTRPYRIESGEDDVSHSALIPDYKKVQGGRPFNRIRAYLPNLLEQWRDHSWMKF